MSDDQNESPAPAPASSGGGLEAMMAAINQMAVKAEDTQQDAVNQGAALNARVNKVRRKSRDLEVEALGMFIDDYEKLKEVFDELDSDKNGFLVPSELTLALSKAGRPVTVEETRAIMEDMDTNKDGQITWEEFKDFVGKIDSKKK